MNKKMPAPAFAETDKHFTKSNSILASRLPQHQHADHGDACRCGPGKPTGSNPNCPACRQWRDAVGRLLRRLMGGARHVV